jgi:hypothetical protein
MERSWADAFELLVLGWEIESFSPSSQPADGPMTSDMAIWQQSRIHTGYIGVFGNISK